MSKYTFTIPYIQETFDHEDMGFELEEWEALSDSDKQNAAEEYAQELFDSITYNLEQQ